MRRPDATVATCLDSDDEVIDALLRHAQGVQRSIPALIADRAARTAVTSDAGLDLDAVQLVADRCGELHQQLTTWVAAHHTFTVPAGP